jgi:phosphocarrier protein FPr
MIVSPKRPEPAAPNNGLRQTVRINNPQGLHMRPAAAFAETAMRFLCSVTVSRGESAVDGKNLWDLLMLAATQGDELMIEVTGGDALEALPALVEILAAIPAED